MKKGKIDDKHVIAIIYFINDDLMNQWGLLVYMLEKCRDGVIAIPKYGTKIITPDVFEKEIETNASIDDINHVKEKLFELRRVGIFPELISICIKDFKKENWVV